MVLLTYLAFFAVLVFYGTAAVLNWRSLLQDSEAKSTVVGSWVRTGGMVAHAAYLVLLGFRYGEFPLVNISNVLTTLALAIVLVHTVVEVRSAAKGTGAFVMAAATLLHLLSWPAIELQPPINELLRSPLFAVHVLFAVCGYTGFILSAIYGIMYLIQFRALKSMRFGPFFKNLPALEFLGRMNIEGALIGLVCLTVAIVMGVLMASRLPDFSVFDAKFIQVFIAWLVYAVLVLGRFQFGWTGRRQVYLSLASFGLFVGSSVIVSMFFRSFHQFS